MIISIITISVCICVLIVGLIIQLKEWIRLRNGCNKHYWVYHKWNEPNSRQVRWCDKCRIKQIRLSNEYFWGYEI